MEVDGSSTTSGACISLPAVHGEGDRIVWQMTPLALCLVYLQSLMAVGGTVSNLAQLWKPMIGNGAAKSA